MVAVTDAAAAATARRIDRLAAAGDAAGVVSGLIDRWVTDMEQTDFGTGCPIAAASLAGPDEPSITDAAARGLRATPRPGGRGADGRGRRSPTRAATRASFAVSAIEGALLQARAERSAQPLRDVEAELTRYLS